MCGVRVERIVTDDTTELLAMRLILGVLIDDIADGTSRDRKAYRLSVKQEVADTIEAMPMDVTDEQPDVEDVRTNLLEVVASMLG